MKRVVLCVCLLLLFMGGSKSAGASQYNNGPTQKISSVSIQSPDNIWYTGTGDYRDYFLIKNWNGNQFQVPGGLPSVKYQPYDYGESTLALSKNNVWMIGSGPDDKQPLRIYHLLDNTWYTVPGPVLHGEEIHALAAVNAKNNIWAVGDYEPLGNNDGAPFKTFIMHWDGNIWKHIDSPNIASFPNRLWSVTALSKNDVWAVGSTNVFNGGIHSLIEHWDGRAWKIIESPMLGGLSAVTALSKNDVWAVGNYNQWCNPTDNTCSSSAFTAHWDGQTWEVISYAVVGSFSSITSLSKNDIWAVGNTQEQRCNTYWICSASTLIEHWDGQAWRIIPSPTPLLPNGYDGSLVSVKAFSQDNVWAVGEAQSKVFLEHWNGQAWKIATLSRMS